MVIKIINEAKRPRVVRKTISGIGKGLTQADIEKGISLKKQRLLIDPSKMKISLNDLIRVANRRKSLLGSNMGQMRSLKLMSVTPNPANKSLSFRGVSDGVDIVKGKERKKAAKYIINLAFYNISFSEVKDSKHQIKVTTNMGKVYYVNLINRDRNPVQTRCECPDFQWSFSYWDKQVRALLGQVVSKVQNYKVKGTGVPRNPSHLPGFCKHIFKFTGAIRQKGYIN